MTKFIRHRYACSWAYSHINSLHDMLLTATAVGKTVFPPNSAHVIITSVPNDNPSKNCRFPQIHPVFCAGRFCFVNSFIGIIRHAWHYYVRAQGSHVTHMLSLVGKTFSAVIRNLKRSLGEVRVSRWSEICSLGKVRVPQWSEICSLGEVRVPWWSEI